MTIIVCLKYECMFNKIDKKLKYPVCKCSAIGIRDNLKCDTFLKIKKKKIKDKLCAE